MLTYTDMCTDNIQKEKRSVAVWGWVRHRKVVKPYWRVWISGCVTIWHEEISTGWCGDLKVGPKIILHGWRSLWFKKKKEKNSPDATPSDLLSDFYFDRHPACQMFVCHLISRVWLDIIWVGWTLSMTLESLFAIPSSHLSTLVTLVTSKAHYQSSHSLHVKYSCFLQSRWLLFSYIEICSRSNRLAFLLIIVCKCQYVLHVQFWLSWLEYKPIQVATDQEKLRIREPDQVRTLDLLCIK